MISILPAYSFQRPADVTAYALGDLVANSTAAASVVPMSWQVPWSKTGGIIQVRGVRLSKSAASIVNASFRAHLFNTLPTFVTAGDNGVFASVVATGFQDGWMARFDASITAAAVDGAAVIGYDPVVPNVSTVLKLATGSRTFYGLIEARAAYTPGSAETFSARPILEF